MDKNIIKNKPKIFDALLCPVNVPHELDITHVNVFAYSIDDSTVDPLITFKFTLKCIFFMFIWIYFNFL